MSDIMLERLWLALLDTITMVGVSGGIALLAGTPLAVLLVLTTPGGILPWPRFNRIAGAIINAFRATPFIVLLVALIPLTRLITGSTIGLWAAVVPLSISATPFLTAVWTVSIRVSNTALAAALDRSFLEARISTSSARFIDALG